MKVNGYFGYGVNLIIVGVLVLVFNIPAKMKRRLFN